MADQHLTSTQYGMDTEQHTSELGNCLKAETCSGSCNKPHACPHIHERETTKPGFYASHSPTREPVHGTARLHPSKSQSNWGAAKLHTLLNATGAESRSRGASAETNTNGKRHVNAQGIG
ncbi:Hypothetical predicted protein [Pelobates cultripes]|uniref:Uncharacterized protein n=1 Tax=Pelobates cultripes TaxID=61616 RepID=A0AAD1RPA8_PELCU|nr:Hypothetical predicted protein [Pelobates cultripes]